MRVKVFLGVTLATTAAGTGVVVSSGSGASPSQKPPSGGQTVESARQAAEDHYLGEHGVKRDDLTQTQVTESGLSIGVANGRDGTRCIAIVAHNSACASPQDISSGRGFAVTSECNRASHTSREDIAGLVPATIAKVELALSDNTTRTATVVNGAYVFENPVAGKSDPYPITLRWVDRSGSVVRADTFPALKDCNGDIPDGARLSPTQRARLQAIRAKVKAAERAAAVRQGLAPNP